MVLSRREICAIVKALRRDSRRVAGNVFVGQRTSAAVVADLLAECAERTAREPLYRDARVMLLRESIDRGSYRVSADAIAEQLLGRLLAQTLEN